jgi:hypothetical protein
MTTAINDMYRAILSGKNPIDFTQKLPPIDYDIDKKAWRVRAFYANYPYVYTYKDGDRNPYQDSWLDEYKEIHDWCHTNCIGKWRTDSHRVIPFADGANNTDYIFNDVGGWDCIFFAFINEADYIWFVTRWA